MHRIFISFLLFSAAVCPAETIYLKNGRTIVAEHVSEKNGKVEYQIGDDVYRIPKTLVEKIDTSTYYVAPPTSSSSATRPKSNEALPPPPLSGMQLRFPKEALTAVRDGRVDLDALNTLEESGNAEAAGAGYFLAGRAEFDRGDRESARRYFERALSYGPDNPVFLTQYAAILIQLGRAREAINFAEHATQNAPDSADAWSILGYAFFNVDRTRDAIPAWEKSLSLRNDKSLAAVLAKAKRELTAEANFNEHDTGHFTLRYEGAATKDTLRQQIIEALENDYNELSSQLGITPTQNIPVILYTEQTFFDVTQAPAWTGAINDGKLRIPVRGLEFLSPELARVLKHELAHSFINQASTGRCPQWLNEGIAQLVEGRQLGSHGPRLALIYQSQIQVPLKSLEGSFMNFSSYRAVLAYQESLAAAIYLNETYGMSDIRRLLEHLAQGGGVQDALRDILHVDYDRFEQDFSQFLINRYAS
ncbi:MAG TPA: tetratricopeptide repeat protein [Terriglobales bacterium]|nr:tetratricopeptide repeat protein [Terriglobales bacterium]